MSLTKDIDDKEAKERLHQRAIKAKAFAYLKRAKAANIPKDCMRIGRDEFCSILHKPSFESVDGFADFIFKKPQTLAKIPYIIIDGGDRQLRTKAGCAILFRLITIDRFGQFVPCSTLSTTFTSFDAKMNKKEVADELKVHDVLFISEFWAAQFNIHINGGIFMDEVLFHRSNSLKPTIISFAEPISSASQIYDLSCGQALAGLSTPKYDAKQKTPSDGFDGEVLKIRVGK